MANVNETLAALREHVESEHNGWGEVYLDNARLPGQSANEFRAHLSALAKRGDYKPRDGYAFGTVLLLPETDLTVNQAKAEIIAAMAACDVIKRRLAALSEIDVSSLTGASEALTEATRIKRDLEAADRDARDTIPVCDVPASLESEAMSVHDEIFKLSKRSMNYVTAFRACVADVIQEAA